VNVHTFNIIGGIVVFFDFVVPGHIGGRLPHSDGVKGEMAKRGIEKEDKWGNG
jgi:hypothetical protein